MVVPHAEFNKKYINQPARFNHSLIDDFFTTHYSSCCCCLFIICVSGELNGRRYAAELCFVCVGFSLLLARVSLCEARFEEF